MKAYTDEYIVKDDGIYRIEQLYRPGGDWERREVLWLPRSAVEEALELWKGEMKHEPVKAGTAEDGKGETKAAGI